MTKRMFWQIVGLVTVALQFGLVIVGGIDLARGHTQSGIVAFLLFLVLQVSKAEEEGLRND